MRVGWICPDTVKCGIAIYSRYYCDALKKKIQIRTHDPKEWINDRKKFISELNLCDLIHIQYEPYLFFHGRNGFYEKLIKKIKKPVIVSIHETYYKDPFSFPRENISGAGFFKCLKEIIYDFRHPVQKAYRKGIRNNFGADCILVHQYYHKEILIRKGVPSTLIQIFPHPVRMASIRDNKNRKPKEKLIIGSTGFINPQYNYDLLFKTLQLIDVEWEFWWIGGLRTDEQVVLRDELWREVEKKGWKNKFHITGWVSDKKQSLLLSKLHLAFALFKSRSSSGSLAAMMGAMKPVFATDLPMFREINAFGKKKTEEAGPIIIVPDNAGKIVKKVKEIISSEKLQRKYRRSVLSYVEKTTYDVMASNLCSLYRTMVK